MSETNRSFSRVARHIVEPLIGNVAVAAPRGWPAGVPTSRLRAFDRAEPRVEPVHGRRAAPVSRCGGVPELSDSTGRAGDGCGDPRCLPGLGMFRVRPDPRRLNPVRSCAGGESSWLRGRGRTTATAQALLCSGLAQFLAGTVPFIQEGVAAGEHALDGQAVRGIGEPIWSGRRAAELVECQLHEALLNVAVEPDVPLWLLCPYDVQTLPAEVVTEAHRSHEVIVEVEHHRRGALYGATSDPTPPAARGRRRALDDPPPMRGGHHRLDPRRLHRPPDPRRRRRVSVPHCLPPAPSTATATRPALV